MGYTPRPDLDAHLKVMTLRQGAAYCQETYHLPMSAEAFAEQMTQRVERFYAQEVQPKPGVERFLSILRQRGIPMYVATATDRPLAEAALGQTGLMPYFQGLLTCQDVGRGKEDPAVFQEALSRLGSRRDATWVFEDALHAIQQAILGFPPIIILDEPTVGLDPKQVVEIRALIRQLSREHTVILSSHILSEIRAVCDKVLIIRKGRFVVCDRPEALEQTLSAAGELELQVRGEEAAARELLQNLSGVLEAELLEAQGDQLRFRLRAEGDIRESLFFACSQAQLPILELKPRMATLEEVFLNLTDEDDEIAAQAAALLQGGVPLPEEDQETPEISEASQEEQEEPFHESDL